jgi:hypothetical protein
LTPKDPSLQRPLEFADPSEDDLADAESVSW